MLSINRITTIFLNLMLVSLLCGLMSVNAVHAKAVNQANTSSEQLDPRFSGWLRAPEKRQYFRYTPSGQKVYLGLIKNKFVVQFKEGVTHQQIERLNAKYQTQIFNMFRKEKNRAPIYLLHIPPERSLKNMLKPYSPERQEVYGVYGYEPIVEWTMPAFHALNARVIPTDEFTVMLSPNASESNLTELNQAHGVEILERDAKNGSYRLRVTSQSDLNSLDMANLYHEQSFIAWAVPDYLSNQEIEDPEARQYFKNNELTPPTYFPVNPDKFVVLFKPGVTDAQIDDLNDKYHTYIVRKIRRGIHGDPIYIFSVPHGKRLKDVLKLYGKQRIPRSGVYGYEPIVEWTMPALSYLGKRVTPTARFSVQLKPGVNEAVLREFNRKHGVEEVRRRSTYSPTLGGTRTVYTLKVTEKSDLNSLDMANLYAEQPFIQWSSLSYHYPAFDSLPPDYPNDDWYPYQWNLNQVSDIDIDAPEAWRIWDDIGDGKGSGITIAIVDSGIEMQHEDLQGKIVEAAKRWDFVDGDDWPEDAPPYHGTQVAGIAAAMTHNNKGIAGVAPNARIMPLRINLDDPNPDQIAEAIDWAREKGAKVINCSFSLWHQNNMKQAVVDASNAGRVVVASAGNEGVSDPQYPADYGENPYSSDPYNIPGVIKVGAIDSEGNRWQEGGLISNLYPDVVAPASVPSTYEEPNQYSDSFGATSAATPHVSGLVALLLSYKSDLTPEQVKDIIQKTADRMGSPDAGGYDIMGVYGYGRINAFRALQYLGGTIPPGQVREWKKERVDPQQFDILIAGDVVIEGGATPATLNIEPGTVIRFEAQDFQSGGRSNTYPELRVLGGTLIANGETEETRIIFESATGGGYPWYGIYYTDTGSEEISFCTIRNAYVGIFFNEFESQFTVSDCIIEHNFFGIYCSYSDYIRIVNNKIDEHWYGVIIFEGSDIQVGDVDAGNTIENNIYHGVYVDSTSYTNVFSNEIRNNDVGVYVHDIFQVYIGDYQYPGGYHDFSRGNNIHHNKDGIQLYNDVATFVEANNIHDNDPGEYWDGIWSYLSSSYVSHNTITSNNGGFEAAYSGIPVLTQNKITGNNGYGVHCYYTYPAMDYGYNEISGHTYNMYVKNVSAVEILARYNNWGLPVNQVDVHIWDDDETGGQEPEVIFSPIYQGSPWAPPLPALTQKQEQKKSYVWALGQNYPNPFNPETWLPYSLKEAVSVTLEIYNARGQLVRVLKFGVQEPGDYLTPATAARWDGRNQHGEQVASGLYFYRFKAGAFRALKKMVLLK